MEQRGIREQLVIATKVRVHASLFTLVILTGESSRFSILATTSAVSQTNTNFSPASWGTTSSHCIIPSRHH